MDFGEKLKEVIKQKYSSIRDFADKKEMNYSQVSQYLHGRKISIEFLFILIEEFPELDLNWLLRDEDFVENTVNEKPSTYKIPLKNDEIINKTIDLLLDLKNQLSQK